MHPHELGPAHTEFGPDGGRVHVIAAQNVAHRGFMDMMSDTGQGALDAPVTPTWILRGHADDELLDPAIHAWASDVVAGGAWDGRLLDELAMPPPKGV